MTASGVLSRALDSRCSEAAARADIADRLFDAVERTLKQASPKSPEADDEAILRQICKSLRKGAKSSVQSGRPLHENIFEFCNKAFESLMAGMSNHKLLHRLDWLHAMDIAIKESFPKEYLLRCGLDAYQRELEWACDAAFEAQRFEYITWEILPQLFSEKKKWKKISTLLDQGRLKALLHTEMPFEDRCGNWVEKYVSTWMSYVVSDWNTYAKNYTLSTPTKPEVADIFCTLVEAAGLPQEMERSCGAPSNAFIQKAASWIFEENDVPAQEPPCMTSKPEVAAAACAAPSLRQRARGRNEGYGKGANPGSPLLSRTLGSPPPSRSLPRMRVESSRTLGSPSPPRSLPRMCPEPSQSPPRPDIQRQHYGLQDVMEASVRTEEERCGHRDVRSEMGGRLQQEGAGMKRSFRVKDELQEEAVGDAGRGDAFSHSSAAETDSSGQKTYGKVARPGGVAMKEELQENDIKSGTGDLNVSAHSNAGDGFGSGQSLRRTGSDWHDHFKGHEGGQEGGYPNWHDKSSAATYKTGIWKDAWGNQQKAQAWQTPNGSDEASNTSWSGWKMNGYDASWENESEQVPDEQSLAKRRRPGA